MKDKYGHDPEHRKQLRLQHVAEGRCPNHTNEVVVNGRTKCEKCLLATPSSMTIPHVRPLPKNHWCTGLKRLVPYPAVLCSNCPEIEGFPADPCGHPELHQTFECPVIGREPKADRFRWGLIVRLSSFWVGGHYSKTNRRLCVNLIPCVTLFFTLAGGDLPKLTDYPHRWLLN